MIAGKPLAVWIVEAADGACPLWDYNDLACDGSRHDRSRESDFVHCAQLDAPYWSR